MGIAPTTIPTTIGTGTIIGPIMGIVEGEVGISSLAPTTITMGEATEETTTDHTMAIGIIITGLTTTMPIAIIGLTIITDPITTMGIVAITGN